MCVLCDKNHKTYTNYVILYINPWSEFNKNVSSSIFVQSRHSGTKQKMTRGNSRTERS
jgi:hypothetical protein